MKKSKYSHLTQKELQDLIKMVRKEGPKQMLPDLEHEEKHRKNVFSKIFNRMGVFL